MTQECKRAEDGRVGGMLECKGLGSHGASSMSASDFQPPVDSQVPVTCCGPFVKPLNFSVLPLHAGEFQMMLFTSL